MSRKIDGIAGEEVLEVGHDLVEVLKLGPDRVNQNQRRTFSSFAIAQSEMVTERDLFKFIRLVDVLHCGLRD